MTHDFKKFPELTNNQMQFYYFESPHKQILEDFQAKVIKVHDGDTIRVRADFRDFDFPIRIGRIDAPELDEDGGKQSQEWLEQKVLNKEVTIIVDPKNRVGKFGRLIGEILCDGENLSEASLRDGMSIPFGSNKEGKIPNIEVFLE